LAANTAPQNQLAIVVRGRVVTAPVVTSPITGGKVEINADFTKQDAEKLAADITG
jgi:preprotein translocase subunit SecD